MTPNDFCYWLTGFFEVSEATSLNEKQIAIIRQHLMFVFTRTVPDNKSLKQLFEDAKQDPPKKIC